MLRSTVVATKIQVVSVTFYFQSYPRIGGTLLQVFEQPTHLWLIGQSTYVFGISIIHCGQNIDLTRLAAIIQSKFLSQICMSSICIQISGKEYFSIYFDRSDLSDPTNWTFPTQASSLTTYLLATKYPKII
jgi:hypothetical protein